MKQISKVLIENFQSHLRSEFDFGRGLNVIIGPSDNGKSAVLRAIRWCLYNEPRGTDFVRSGARECRVTVTMSDGAEIVRELQVRASGTAARSRYVVRVPDQEPQIFEGFGTEVPAEVMRAHGMPQVLLDTDKRVLLSFGTQLEGPFLMTESGSFRARAIGRLLGVHVVDAAARGTQKDLRQVKLEIGRMDQRLQQYDQELQQYADIPEQEARLERAGAMLAQAEAFRQRLQQLERLREALDRAEREEIMTEAQLHRLGDLAEAERGLRQAELLHLQGARLERLKLDQNRVEQESRVYKTRIDALTALPIVEERAREAAERQTRLTGLSRIEAELKLREAELAKAGQVVQRLAAVPRAGELLQGVADRVQRLERLQERLTQLQDAGQRLTKGGELLQQTEQDLRQHLSEYEGVLRRLGKCPTCMQPVEPGSIRRILAELAGGPVSGHSH
jgi:DNA repair protein SbcC/Rad50